MREPGGALRVKDPALLLDAWREEYRFDKHVPLQGHVAARSGDALARFVGDTLAEGPVDRAATGLAAASQMTHFAAFRIATFFLAELMAEKPKHASEYKGEQVELVPAMCLYVPEASRHHEVVDGVLVEKEAASGRHGRRAGSPRAETWPL